MNQEKKIQLLIELLLAEGFVGESFIRQLGRPSDQLRALMNVRPPIPVSEEIVRLQDEILSVEREQKPLVDPSSLPTVAEQFPQTAIPHADRLVVWRGDITTLRVGAIVNAANDALLGCFLPLHNCIDNSIHSAAGIQLRLACNELMEAQGSPEPTGSAKITSGYNLPARYVLHTVGPNITGDVTEEDARLLASCYTSCLDLAAANPEIKTVAFCSISTGVFGYPKDKAASTAIRAVTGWLDQQADRFDLIIFDIFTNDDVRAYRSVFG